jgi:hypothetical protein
MALESDPGSGPQDELASVIAAWVRSHAEPALAAFGGRLRSADFTAPENLLLRWDLPSQPPMPMAFDLLFHLEERVRKVFPEVRRVSNTTDVA